MTAKELGEMVGRANQAKVDLGGAIVRWRTVAGSIAAIFVAGGVTTAFVTDRVSSVPNRVGEIEIWKDSLADPALRFLVCSQKAENQGKDPKPCENVLKGTRELLEDRR